MTRSNSKTLGIVIPILLALTLGGCFGSPPPVPRDHYYRILVSMPEGRSEVPSLPGVVSVPPLEADGLLRERPLLFTTSQRPHEVQQYVYHYWSDPPPRMLQDQLAAYLRQSRLASSVVTPSLRVRPDFEVIGRIKRLERTLDGAAPGVSVELELALIEPAEDRLLVIRSYAAAGTAQDTTVEASVVALNTAVTEIFGRFLADARQTSLAARESVSGITPAR